VGGPCSEESGCGRRHRATLGPLCVTERGTHLLGNARQEPAPALLCALARHLGQFDRVGGLVRTQAMNLHPRAAVVPWLSRLDRESGLGGGSEDAPGVVELDLT